MMKIKVNGQERTFKAPLRIYDVLEQEGFAEMMIAVAQNGRFIARDTYNSATVTDGDEIEIVAPMQGG